MDIYPWSYGQYPTIFPFLFQPCVSLRNVFTYSSSLPRKLSAVVITSKQTFRFKMRKSTTEKHITPQIHLEKSCLEMLLNAFVLPTFMLEIQKKKKSSGPSTSLFHWSLSTALELGQYLFSRLTKFLLVSVYPFSSIAQVFLPLYKKTVKYTFVQYMHKKEKKNQPTGALTARFH